MEHADEENGGAFGLNFQFDCILYFEDILVRRTIFFSLVEILISSCCLGK